MQGLHVPAIPFCDVEGNDGTFPPAQMERLVPKLNVGVMFGLTVTANVAVVAHCPCIRCKCISCGILIIHGCGTPCSCYSICDAAGNGGTVPPAQIVKTCSEN